MINGIKPFDKSRHIPTACFLLSMAEVILSCRYNNSANEVDCFFLKPYLDIELSDCTKRSLETSKRLLRLIQVYN